MRIAALGGAGDMGSRAVSELASTADVDGVTILDHNVAAAESLADSLAESKARIDVRGIDADDHDAVVSALRGHDVAMSALGPFFRFERSLVRAALDAGVDYASICDEWEAAEAVFEEFDARARAEGRFVVTGLGASPGLTNVGACLLADRMEQVDEVNVYVYQPLDAGGGEAVVHHMLHIMTGRVAVWRSGRRERVRALSESRVVEFPRFGPVKVWNMGHSEPYTLPRYFPDVRDVSFHMGYGRGSSLLVVPARLHLFARQSVCNTVVRLVSRVGHGRSDRAPGLGALRIDVRGRQQGRAVDDMLCGVGQMREVTGLSLAVGTLMLGRKQLRSSEPGVYAPEGCLQPDVFYRTIRDSGVAAYRDLNMTVPLEV